MVAQLSGHKRPKNLAAYAVASTEQQHEINDILHNSSSKKNHLPNSSVSFGPLAMPHIPGQSPLQPLLSRRPQVQSRWKLHQLRLARCQFIATLRFLTFWTSPLDSMGYFQMQPWTDLSHSTLISTIIIMQQPIQQYPHSHTCKSSKLCTSPPSMSCRDLRELTGLEPNNIVFMNISMRVGARDGYLIKNFEQISMKVGAIFNCCWFSINKVVYVFIVQGCSEFIVF